LDWHLGYPLVIGLSVLVVLASLWYFKRKKLM
jgi:LPXTG-motif cell wall-anchored protein